LNLRTHLTALCGTVLLFSAPALAQETGYSRTYVIQADGAWVGPGIYLEPAFIQITDGRVAWVGEQDRRREGKNILGQSTGKTKMITVSGILAPGLVDAWSSYAPADFETESRPSGTRRVEDSLPMQVAMEDPVLYAQVMAARSAGVSATYIAGGRSGLRRGVGTAVEFTALDLPLKAGREALDFAVGSAAQSGFERTYQSDELWKAFEEAKEWRTSWDDYDEEVEKYAEKLEKYQEKLEKYLTEKKEWDEKQEAKGSLAGEGEGEDKEPKAPKRPKLPKEPESSIARDLLLGAIDGATQVRVVADRVRDIRLVIKLKKEFGLDLVLLGAYDADFLAKELAAAEIAVILPVVQDHHATPNPDRSFAKRYLALREAQVTVAIASGGSDGAQFMLPIRAGEIVAAGGSQEDVWASLTTVPAKILGLTDYGTLHTGMSATMILFEGASPFDASAPFKAHKPK
jgi:imidazolonepropionase-like amidohydrolase